MSYAEQILVLMEIIKEASLNENTVFSVFFLPSAAHRGFLDLLGTVMVFDDDVLVILLPSAVSPGRHLATHCRLLQQHL